MGHELSHKQFNSLVEQTEYGKDTEEIRIANSACVRAKLDERIVKSFMDIIVLKHLENDHSIGGYDTTTYLDKRFRMLLSPGTVYNLLYSLERQSLIEGKMNQGKRMFQLTAQGEKYLSNIHSAKKHIQTLLSYIFSEV